MRRGERKLKVLQFRSLQITARTVICDDGCLTIKEQTTPAGASLNSTDAAGLGASLAANSTTSVPKLFPGSSTDNAATCIRGDIAVVALGFVVAKYA